jgi:hypothetical protein
MPIIFDESMQQRLKQAEMAERELARLQPLASEAEELRTKQAQASKFADSLRRKDQALDEAQQLVEAAGARQVEISDLLNEASQAVSLLFAAMKDVSNKRRRAAEALAVVDRVDYEVELAEAGEEEIARNRDPRGLAYALAARHGDVRVQQMLEDLDPGFNLLRNCNLNDALHRDVASFVTGHVSAKQTGPAKAHILGKPVVTHTEGQEYEEHEEQPATIQVS